jgi:hypothetical protein
MIVFIRCNDIISDSRAKKYLDFLNREHVDYRIIAWDRLGNSVKLPNAVYCPSKSKYNQGGVAAIIDRLKWMWFILKTLFSFHDNLRIHACDLDAAFPAAVYKLLSRRKNYVLFDVFDWISDTLYNQGKIVSSAFVFMEWLSVKEADHIIICEPERIKQIPYNIEESIVFCRTFPLSQPPISFTMTRTTISTTISLPWSMSVDSRTTGALPNSSMAQPKVFIT